MGEKQRKVLQNCITKVQVEKRIQKDEKKDDEQITWPVKS